MPRWYQDVSVSERIFEYLQQFRGKQNEADEPQSGHFTGMGTGRCDRDARHLTGIPAVHPRRDGGQCDAGTFQLPDEIQAGIKGRAQQRRIGLPGTPVRSHSVDDPGGGQIEARSGDSPSHRKTVRQARSPQLPASREKLRPRGTMDGPIDPTSAQQGGVGGVDHGVDLLPGDVPLNRLDDHLVSVLSQAPVR